MANIKISELNPLLTVEDADVLPIVDNAVTKKVTAAILRSYTQGNSVLLTGNQTVAGIKTFTSQIASSVATGTAPFSVASTTKVTNLNADLLDGLSSADFQATLSGTGIVKSTAGTISYLTDNSTNWNTAFNDKINSAAVTGSGTNTLTLTQQDAGTITATWVNGTLIREIRNTTGATLTKGTIVYISGATGNKPTVSKAIATGDSTSAQTFGFVQENILNNANGYVVVIGDLTGVDTSAFAEGAQLYLSATTAGTFTDVKQYAPNHLVYVGIVTRAHPTLGQIEVNIQNGYELDELHNVAAQSPSNGDILQYVTSTGLWTKIAGTTSNISEGTNLYFTNARSRSAFSESVTGLDYNSTTGVLSTTSGYGIPTTASQTTWDTAYNDSIVSAAVTGTTTKTLTLNQQDGGSVTASWTDDNTDAVSSVFGRTGAVVATSGDYTTTQVTEGTNLYYTEARVNANTNVAANTAARHNAVTLGTANGLSLSTQQLSLGLASGSATGALSSTDWTTFNNKQNALTNPITGTGTTNYLPKFTGASALGNSSIFDNGTNVYINATTGTYAAYGYSFGVKASSGTQTYLSIATPSQTLDSQGLVLGVGADDASLILRDDKPFSFWTNNTEKMRITSAGNVGIGTAIPVTALDVNGSIAISNGSGYFQNIYYNGGWKYIGNGSAWATFTEGTAGGYVFYSAGNNTSGANASASPTEKIRFTNGGSILVNTTTDAGYKLDVNGTARVKSTGFGVVATFHDTANSGFTFTADAFNGFNAINSNGQLLLNIDGSEKIRLTSSLASFTGNVNTGGNLLINNTSVSKKGYKFQSPSSNWSPQESGIYFTPADGVNAATTFSVELWDGIGGTTNALSIAPLGTATFSGRVNIGNPVAVAVAVASTHKVEISIGGTTYYLLATT